MIHAERDVGLALPGWKKDVSMLEANRGPGRPSSNAAMSRG